MLRRLKIRKLRFDILTIFLSIFIATTFVILYYSYTRSSDAVLKLGNDLIERTHLSIIEKLDNFFRPAPFVKIAELLMGNDEVLDNKDMQSLTEYMHIILQSYPQLNSAYIADEFGNIFMESRYAENNEFIIPLVNNKLIPPQTRFISEIITGTLLKTLTVEYKNQKGETFKTDHDLNVSFDPRTRPWYQGAKNTDAQQWIGTYEFYTSKKEGITIAFPIKKQNKIVGVAAADLNTSIISDQLKLFSANICCVFIISNNEKVISYNADKLLTLNKNDNPLIFKAYTIHKNEKKNKFTFEFNHINYIAHFTPYALNPNEAWEIASVIPIDTFIKPIKLTNEKILLFSLSMLMLGLLLVIISSNRISRPIMRLAEDTRNIVKLNFNKKSKIKTHIYEVQVMIDALHATKTALFSFAKYVPKSLVEKLLASGIVAEVGGRKENITILFTDIANFTEKVERTDPELLLAQISEYLNELTIIIQRHQGNIDKYIGDAVMAFWGAPLPDENHILHACEAVLACQWSVRDMNAAWAKENKLTFPTRFGLNTGDAIVGNMGSVDRLNYTVIGDNVNLAARLEACNKLYRTEIIVSEYVYEKCKEHFVFRSIDLVTVKGKTKPVHIYELMGGNPGSDFPATAKQLKLSRMTNEGVKLFQANEYKKALEIFKKIAEEFPDDGVAELYVRRCESA